MNFKRKKKKFLKNDDIVLFLINMFIQFPKNSSGMVYGTLIISSQQARQHVLDILIQEVPY